MTNVQIANVVRGILLLLFQVLVLKNACDNVPKLQLFLYPLIVLQLPFRTPHWAQLAVGFFVGLTIDMFYQYMGLHTSALVFTAFLRHYLCTIMEPRGGYELDESPTKASMGAQWFFQFTGILMFVHIFVYYVLERPGINLDVLLRIVYGYGVSMFLVLLYAYLINPKR
jgi:hypothetical protein